VTGDFEPPPPPTHTHTTTTTTTCARSLSPQTCCQHTCSQRKFQAWDVGRGFCPFTKANLKHLPLADGSDDVGNALERLQSVGDVPFRCWPPDVQRRYKALAAQKSRRKRRAEDSMAPSFALQMPSLSAGGCVYPYFHRL
jgi:hypothetical protein